MNYKNQVNNLRHQINQADREIITAIAKRVAVVKKVGNLKKQHKIKPLDQSRWDSVLEKVANQATNNDLDPEVIKQIYETLHKYSLKLESDNVN